MKNKKDKWYEEQLAQESEKTDPRGKLYYESFEEYLRDFPEAKEAGYIYYQQRPYQLIKLATKSGAASMGLTGDYFTLYAQKAYNNLPEWYIFVSDCDDGKMYYLGTEQHVKDTLKNIKEAAPLDFQDLKEVFGFVWD